MRLFHPPPPPPPPPPPIEAEMMMKGVRIVEPTDWASTLLLRSLLPGEYLSKSSGKGGKKVLLKLLDVGRGACMYKTVFGIERRLSRFFLFRRKVVSHFGGPRLKDPWIVV